MTIPELIQMVQRRLAYLSQLRTSASNLGDVVQVGLIDGQIAETESTLEALKTLV